MKFFYAILIIIFIAGCVPPSGQVTETPLPTISQTPTSTSTPQPTPTDTPSPANDPVLVGAGDIAGCEGDGDEATANLLDNIPGTVFTTGDNAYPDGTASNFRDCYDVSWGRHKDRTYPSAGNHDYHVEGAADYFDYFGSVAGNPEQGHYSYDLGDWHIIVLNSNLSVKAGSEQEQWLRADLSAHPVACTLAYWHHPRFSSGINHGSSPKMQPLWQALYDYGADVVLNGHEHNYERFAPQDPEGFADPVRGIREFVVGSGGRSHYGFAFPIPNSEIRNDDTYGVLKMTLHPDSYSWEFIPEAGKTFTDSGTSSCFSHETNDAGELITFTPSDDATIKSDSPDENYGSKGKLEADHDPSVDFLIKFDVSGINQQSVLSAKLRLYNVNSSEAGGNLYEITDNAWLEDSVTWNTAPAAEASSLASIGPVIDGNWYEIDVTSLITEDGTYSFRISTASKDGADYTSKDGAAESAPQLIIRLK